MGPGIPAAFLKPLQGFNMHSQLTAGFDQIPAVGPRTYCQPAQLTAGVRILVESGERRAPVRTVPTRHLRRSDDLPGASDQGPAKPGPTGGGGCGD